MGWDGMGWLLMDVATGTSMGTLIPLHAQNDVAGYW